MRMVGSSLHRVFLLLVVLAAVVGGGCATTESENVSETPWNRPQGWETGLPGGMFNQYPR